MQISLSNTFIIEKCQMNGNFYSSLSKSFRNLCYIFSPALSNLLIFLFFSRATKVSQFPIQFENSFSCRNSLEISLFVFPKAAGSYLNNLDTPKGNHLEAKHICKEKYIKLLSSHFSYIYGLKYLISYINFTL